MSGMGKSVTPGSVSKMLADPSPDSTSQIPEIIVQVVDLKSMHNSTTRFTFMASDGKSKIRAMLPTNFASEVNSGNLQNLGLIRVLDYTCNSIPNQPDKALIVRKCEVVLAALEAEIKENTVSSTPIFEVKKELPETVLKSHPATVKPLKEEEIGIVLKPKQDVVAKSATQIIYEQRANAAPAARMGMTRRVHSLISLNPYQGSWTIKVRVTSKGSLRTYKNARGEGCVFNVELTDADGTQIQATMFNEAAKKFFSRFEMGKVYYVSKGTLKVANKQFKTVKNDYELTLNENAEVEEVTGESVFVPETKFDFKKIDQLGSYVNGRDLVDVVGVVQNVSSTLSIRRKSDNETIPKREITMADDSGKTVTVSLWNDLATNVGQELLDIMETNPVVAISCLKVGDFQGVSLSTISKSTVRINPELPEAEKLRSWYDSEGRGSSLASVGSSLITSTKASSKTMYSDRVFLSHITSDINLGQGKPVFFSIKAYVSFIKPDQMMWYRACKTCNKKVTEAVGNGYWCEACQKNDDEFSLRYILAMKVSDASGEAWFSVFNDYAEKVIGYSADELDRIKTEEGIEKYQVILKEATWSPHLFRVSVGVSEYQGERRQRITVRAQAPVDCSAESKYLLGEISKLMAS